MRFKNAADIGLKALNKCGRDGYDEKEGITDDDRMWFTCEDQTIGYLTIADMVNRKIKKNDILNMIDDASKINRTMGYQDTPNGIFQLAHTKYYRDNGWMDKYIDACIESRNEVVNELANLYVEEARNQQRKTLGFNLF